MPAWPFGHPTFAQYLTWVKTQGCTVASGYSRGKTGAIMLTKIDNPKMGKHVIEVGTKQTDYLEVSTVDRLDRRLGVQSKFFDMP